MKMKTVKIFGILISLLFLFASCGLLWNDGETEVTINLPYVTSTNGRAIDSGKKDDLRNATKSYRVHMNDTVIEATGGNFSAFFTVGIKLDIYVECLNSKREVIIRTNVKSIVVESGQNIVDFNLMTDGNEIINTGVFYNYGDAELHGNKFGLPSSVAVEKGEVFTVDDGTNMAWQHAADSQGFAGWKTNVALTGDVDSGTQNAQAGSIVQSGGKYIMPEGGVLLTAQWNKKTYTITYVGNAPTNSTGAQATVTGMPQQLPGVSALDDATAANAPSITNLFDGKSWSFTGWNTDANGNGTRYSSGQSITRVTDNMTLYAQWSDKTMYRVDFAAPVNKPGTYTPGYGQPSPQNVEENTAATWTNPAASGWTFEGWDVSDPGDSNTTELSANTTSYTPKGNTTLTAKWTTKKYTITFNTDGGNTVNPVTDFDVKYGGAFTNATKDGYSFQTWQFGGTDYTADSLKTAIEAGTVGATSTTIELTARWEIDYKTNKANWAIGDIVLQDSSGTLVAINKDAYASRDTSKGDGVAIVYKNASNKVYIVGKDHEAKVWADKNSLGYGKINSLVTEVATYDPMEFDQSSYIDGSTGWSKLQAAVSDTGTSGNYPAWEYCNNYGGNKNLSGDLATGWYFPSFSEMFAILQDKSSLESALATLGGSFSHVYWSSSQYGGNEVGDENKAWVSDGSYGLMEKFLEEYVCPVLALSY